MREIFGPNREEDIGDGRKLHLEESNDLHSPPNVTRVIKLRMRWLGHVARRGRRENQRFWRAT
jgi:hypothetical protein